MMFAMDVSPEMTLPKDESAYIAKVDARERGGDTPNGFEAGAVKSANDGTTYSLTMVNQSAQPWIFYVYQTFPQQTSDIFSLAWLASPYKIVPKAQITFKWQVNYTFLWAQTGVLQPGVSFVAGMSIDADPAAGDTTQFSVNPGPNLTPAQPGGGLGTLTIYDQSDVPNSQFSVGIGMGDAGTFATQAGTNLKHVFTPTPSYWVAAGIDQKVGTVLDIQTVTQTAPIIYPANVYSLTATLQNDNTWTVTP
ncbi:protein rhiA [Corallococcus carmarthensis]|uniref:Protein rhiA n=1 Tax=Corallococcus carmarthensis TaxID=2316728 RepID=A0A3A8KIY8_9BACT|nr:protein rhiA [Corallococcus carmarthensis]RKH07900.1 protein rhiA [Corallococcus carmarthensis]